MSSYLDHEVHNMSDKLAQLLIEFDDFRQNLSTKLDIQSLRVELNNINAKIDENQQISDQTGQKKFKTIKKASHIKLIGFMAVNNLPFTALTDASFLNFCSALNPGYKPPSDKTLHKYIFEIADFVRKEQLYDLIGKYITLMVDGGSYAGTRYFAVCCFDGITSYFLTLIELQNQTAASLVNALKPVVEMLIKMDITPIAICADGCTTNLKAFNEVDPNSLAIVTGVPLIRIYCHCHLLNLTIKEFITKIECNLHEYIVSILNKLKNNRLFGIL